MSTDKKDLKKAHTSTCSVSNAMLSECNASECNAMLSEQCNAHKKDLKKAHTSTCSVSNAMLTHILVNLSKIHTNIRMKKVWSNWILNRKAFVIFHFLLFSLLICRFDWFNKWTRFKISLLFGLFVIFVNYDCCLNKQNGLD